MFEIFEHILFFLFVLPFLMVEKGLNILNARLEKQGYPKIDMFYVLLAALVLLLIILIALGYRW